MSLNAKGYWVERDKTPAPYGRATKDPKWAWVEGTSKIRLTKSPHTEMRMTPFGWRAV